MTKSNRKNTIQWIYKLWFISSGFKGKFPVFSNLLDDIESLLTGNIEDIRVTEDDEENEGRLSFLVW